MTGRVVRKKNIARPEDVHTKKYVMARRKFLSNTRAAPVTDECGCVLHQMFQLHGKVTILFGSKESLVWINGRKEKKFCDNHTKTSLSVLWWRASPKVGLVEDAHCGDGVCAARSTMRHQCPLTIHQLSEQTRRTAALQMIDVKC